MKFSYPEILFSHKIQYSRFTKKRKNSGKQRNDPCTVSHTKQSLSFCAKIRENKLLAQKLQITLFFSFFFLLEFNSVCDLHFKYFYNQKKWTFFPNFIHFCFSPFSNNNVKFSVKMS